MVKSLQDDLTEPSSMTIYGDIIVLKDADIITLSLDFSDTKDYTDKTRAEVSTLEDGTSAYFTNQSDLIHVKEFYELYEAIQTASEESSNNAEAMDAIDNWMANLNGIEFEIVSGKEMASILKCEYVEEVE